MSHDDSAPRPDDDDETLRRKLLAGHGPEGRRRMEEALANPAFLNAVRRRAGARDSVARPAKPDWLNTVEYQFVRDVYEGKLVVTRGPEDGLGMEPPAASTARADGARRSSVPLAIAIVVAAVIILALAWVGTSSTGAASATSATASGPASAPTAAPRSRNSAPRPSAADTTSPIEPPTTAATSATDVAPAQSGTPAPQPSVRPTSQHGLPPEPQPVF